MLQPLDQVLQQKILALCYCGKSSACMLARQYYDNASIPNHILLIYSQEYDGASVRIINNN